MSPHIVIPFAFLPGITESWQILTHFVIGLKVVSNLGLVDQGFWVIQPLGNPRQSAILLPLNIQFCLSFFVYTQERPPLIVSPITAHFLEASQSNGCVCNNSSLYYSQAPFPYFRAWCLWFLKKISWQRAELSYDVTQTLGKFVEFKNLIYWTSYEICFYPTFRFYYLFF